MAEQQISVEESARKYVGERGLPGDIWNNAFSVQLNLGDQRDWPHIKALDTYAGYLQNTKLKGKPALAEAVIAASDAGLVAKHDEIIARINSIIGEGVTSANQFIELNEQLNAMRTLIYG